MADSFSEEEEEEEPASSGFRDRRSPRVFLDQPSSLLSSPGPARSISFPDDVRFNDFITVAIRFRPVFAPPSVERKADLPFCRLVEFISLLFLRPLAASIVRSIISI